MMTAPPPPPPAPSSELVSDLIKHLHLRLKERLLQAARSVYMAISTQFLEYAVTALSPSMFTTYLTQDIITTLVV